MRSAIAATAVLFLAACGSEEGDSKRSASFSIDMDQLTIQEGVGVRVPYNVSNGVGKFTFEPANTVNVSMSGGDLVVTVAQDITDIETVTGSVVHSIDGNTSKQPVSVTLVPETRIILAEISSPVELTEYSDSIARYDLIVEPTSKGDDVEASILSEGSGLGVFIDDGQLGFRAGSPAASGLQTHGVEIKFDDTSEHYDITFSVAAGVEPSTVSLAGDLLTNQVFTEVRADNSELLYFYADLAYLAGTINQETRDSVQGSCYDGQSGEVGSVVNARESLNTAFTLVESGEAALAILDDPIEQYQGSIDVLADNTMNCINDFVANNLSTGVPMLPSNGLAYSGGSASVFMGSTDFGSQSGSTWAYSPQWAFLEELGY